MTQACVKLTRTSHHVLGGDTEGYRSWQTMFGIDYNFLWIPVCSIWVLFNCYLLLTLPHRLVNHFVTFSLGGRKKKVEFISCGMTSWWYSYSLWIWLIFFKIRHGHSLKVRQDFKKSEEATRWQNYVFSEPHSTGSMLWSLPVGLPWVNCPHNHCFCEGWVSGIACDLSMVAQSTRCSSPAASLQLSSYGYHLPLPEVFL